MINADVSSVNRAADPPTQTLPPALKRVGSLASEKQPTKVVCPPESDVSSSLYYLGIATYIRVTAGRTLINAAATDDNYFRSGAKTTLGLATVHVNAMPTACVDINIVDSPYVGIKNTTTRDHIDSGSGETFNVDALNYGCRSVILIQGSFARLFKVGGSN